MTYFIYVGISFLIFLKIHIHADTRINLIIIIDILCLYTICII